MTVESMKHAVAHNPSVFERDFEMHTTYLHQSVHEGNLEKFVIVLSALIDCKADIEYETRDESFGRMFRLDKIVMGMIAHMSSHRYIGLYRLNGEHDFHRMMILLLKQGIKPTAEDISYATASIKNLMLYYSDDLIVKIIKRALACNLDTSSRAMMRSLVFL